MAFFYIKFNSITLLSCGLLAIFFFKTSTIEQDTTQVYDNYRINVLIKKASKFRSRNIDSAELDVIKALRLSTDINDTLLIAKCHRVLGQILSEKLGENNLYRSVTHVEKAIEFFRLSGDSIEVFKTINNLSNTYLRMEDHANGLKTALSAVEMGEKLNANGDFKQELGVAYLSLGSIYSVMKLYDKALVSYEKGKSYVDKDSRFYSAAIANSANINYKLKNYKEALLLFDETYLGYKKYNDLLGITRILAIQGMIFYDMDSLQQSKKKYLEVLSISKSKNHYTSYVETLNRLALLENKSNNPDSAMYYTDSALKLSDSLSFLDKKVVALNFKGKLLEKKGDSTAAVAFFHESQLLKDSILGRQKTSKSHAILLDYKEAEYTKKIGYFQSLLNRRNDAIIIISILLILIGLLSYFFIKKYKFRLLRSNNLRQDLEATLNEEKEAKDYMSRKLASSSAFIASNSVVLKEVNDLLENIKKLVKEEGVKENIGHMQIKINDKISLDEMWDSFFKHFDEVHPKFLKSISSKSNLSKTELKLCAFLKMNLTTKEISELMNISSSSLRVTTHRIKKKLHLSKSTSLHSYLHSNEFW